MTLLPDLIGNVTLTDGFRMMVPQPQLTTERKYAVAHYIREAFLHRYNPKAFFEITDSYLNSHQQASKVHVF